MFGFFISFDVVFSQRRRVSNGGKLHLSGWLLAGKVNRWSLLYTKDKPESLFMKDHVQETSRISALSLLVRLECFSV